LVELPSALVARDTEGGEGRQCLTTKEEHGGELTGGRRRRLELQLRRKARSWLVLTVAGDGAASVRRRRG
jgi:hypothetical protein